MEYALQGAAFERPRVKVSYRKSVVTNITDMNLIPEEFIKYAEPTPDKDAIKKVLKSGEAVPGAELEERQSMSIK